MLSVAMFALVFFGLVGFWAWSAWGIVRLVRLGRSAPERFEDVGWRLTELFKDVILQRALIRERDGWWHVVIFYGFLAVSVGSVEMTIEGFRHGFSFAFLGTPFTFVMLAQDVLAVGIILAIVASHVRRLVVKPFRLRIKWKHQLDAMFCLWLIAIMMVTLVTERGAEFRAHEILAAQGAAENGHLAPTAMSLVSHWFHGLLDGVSLGTAETIWGVSWWVHMVTLLGFTAYLPYSKHFHVFSAIPNLFFRSKHPHGRQRPVPGLLDAMESGSGEFPDENIVNRVEDMTWKDVLDLYTCMECGRCQAACPATNTGKMLNPRQLIWDLRNDLNENGDAILAAHAEGTAEEQEREPLAGGVIDEQVLWSCTSCAGCIEWCPVGIEHVEKIIGMRRHLAMMEGNMPGEVQGFFEKVERSNNPYGLPQADRAKWTEDAEVSVPVVGEDADDPEWLWWVGCAGSYDERNQKVSHALARIFDAADLDYGILGTKEFCNGETARRMGNELLGQMMTSRNVETMNELGVQKIVTGCPHCFNTLEHEYPDFGGEYEVHHSSELVARLIDEGKLDLSEEVKQSVVYHDSCYLGRYNGMYDEQRAGLEAVPGVDLVEAERNREKGFCCGGGGGRVWMEEDEGKRINVERTEELLAEETEAIGVGCPFCMTMMEDGVKAKKKEEDVQVLEVSEIIAQAVAEEEAIAEAARNGNGDGENEEA